MPRSSPITLLEQLRKAADLLDRGFAPMLGLLAAVLLLSSIFEALGVAVVFVVFELAVNAERVPRVSWLASMAAADRSGFILLACLALLLTFIVKAAISLFASWLKWHLQWRIHIRLASMLLAGYIRNPLSFHAKNNSTVLLRNIVTNVSATAQSCILGVVDIISDALLLVGIFAVLLLLQPVTSLIALATIASLGALFWRLGHPYFSRWGARANQVAGEMYRTATEPLVGIKTIKVLGREAFFVDQFRLRLTEYAKVNRDHSLVLQLPRQIFEVLVIAGLLATIAFSVVNDRSPADVIPVLALFAAAAYRFMPSVIRIVTGLQNLRFAGAALDSIYGDIVAFRSFEAALVPRSTDSTTPTFGQEITLSGITFSYEGARDPTLEDVSLTLRRGEAVAVVGPSGAGKTTLADVTLGLHPTTAGVLSVDGIAYPDPSHLPRGLFGYVPQETFLIDDSIRRNVALGVADTAISDDRVKAALESAALGDFVAALPDGLDTQIGERGTRLSGGQRQRLGIARAIYEDPPILILDEATSSLDSLTEAEITEAIDRLHGHKTLLIIAHRLSTVRRCERIVFLESGRVTDIGTFAELSQRNPRFSAMVREMDLAAHAPSSAHAAAQ